MTTVAPQFEIVVVKNTFLDVENFEGTHSPPPRRRSTLPPSFTLSPKLLEQLNDLNDEDGFDDNFCHFRVSKVCSESLSEVSTEVTSEPSTGDSDTESLDGDFSPLIHSIPQVVVTFVEDSDLASTEQCFQGMSSTSSSRPATLPPRDVAQYRNVFEYVDKDGDGFITSGELGSVLRRFVQHVTDSELEDLVSSIDLAGNGRIDFAEFLMLMSHQAPCEVDELSEAFQLFDLNQDGLIDAADLQRTMATLGDSLTISQASTAIGAFDTDGDGHIDYHEFVEMMDSEFLGEFIAMMCPN